MCCQTGGGSRGQLAVTVQSRRGFKTRWAGSYPQDDADGGHPGRGHDLGAVGHQVEQRGHDALGAVVELVAQEGRQVSVNQPAKRTKNTGQFPVEVRFGWFMVPPGIVY